MSHPNVDQDSARTKTELASSYIEARVPEQLRKPRIGIICGSGLGGLGSAVGSEIRCSIPYREIPCFAQPSVSGHAGELVFGKLGDRKTRVVLMVGRVHYYEGHDLTAATLPVRVLRSLGIEVLLITNAAGALNDDYAVGDLMVIMDHINLPGLAGNNPLRGPDDFGHRFPALSDAYDLELRRSIHRVWRHKGDGSRHSRRLHEGVYAFVGGPNYETRAECRMLKLLGADVVGMSTVGEVLVARQLHVRVAALSLITNKAIMVAGPRGDEGLMGEAGSTGAEEDPHQIKANHTEVLAASQEAAVDVEKLFKTLVNELSTQLLEVS